MRILLALFVGGVLSGCTGEPAKPPAAKPDAQAKPNARGTSTVKPESEQAKKSTLLPTGLAAKDYPHLHNLLRVTDRIYSGGEPAEEEAFAELAELGVRTVVSVDGAKPNLEAAKKHGIRYVHIPIGYAGVPKEAGESLAHVVREVEGPIYVHCHHGKHRGPAAAAVACIAPGDASGKDALQILLRAGTSKDYAGLWRDVEGFQPPPAGAKLPELVELAKVDSFAAAMSQVDRSFDNLKLCQTAKWSTPADQPDLAPEQQALLLEEGLHEAVRQSESAAEEMKTWLAEAEEKAKQLRSQLKEKNADSATKLLASLDASCKQCHKKYRDQGPIAPPPKK